MSLILLLDEDSQAKQLVQLLQTAKHDVLTINEVGMVGAADSTVMAFAQEQKRVLLTRNCSDFYKLHQNTTTHSGILAVYQDADLRKNMSYQDIVSAIANLEASGSSIIGQFVVLNQWSY